MKRAFIFFLLFLCVLTACTDGSSTTPTSSSTDQSSASSQPTPQPTITPTQAAIVHPTPTSTIAPTHPTANAGPAILGADISAFIAKYGQSNIDSQPNNGSYNFALYGHSQVDNLNVVTKGSKALSIFKDSPTDQGWNKSEAIAACLVFIPSDSVYKREMTLLDPQGNPMDIQRVYYSPSLAKQFPSSDFTDENGNQTTPGTFGIVLAYASGSTTSFLFCSVQVGLQQK